MASSALQPLSLLTLLMVFTVTVHAHVVHVECFDRFHYFLLRPLARKFKSRRVERRKIDRRRMLSVNWNFVKRWKRWQKRQKIDDVAGLAQLQLHVVYLTTSTEYIPSLFPEQ